MGQKEISALTAASSLAGTDLMEIETAGGASRKAALNVLQDLLFPPGFIADFGNTAAPTGWLACDGAAVSRSTYARLFAAIGEVWGVGNGTTTFNVPDQRGASRRGTGSHGSETMADGNPFAGPAVGAFEDDQIQGHWHDVDRGAAAGGAAEEYSVSGENGQSPTEGGAVIDNSWFSATTPGADATNGAPRTGDETRSFAAGVLVCIKS